MSFSHTMHCRLFLFLSVLTLTDAGYYVLIIKVEDPMPMRLRLFDEETGMYDHSLRMKQGEFRINMDEIPAVWNGRLEFRDGELTEVLLTPRLQPKLITVYAPERVHLRIRYQVECAKDFYGSLCSVLCTPSDNFSCGDGGEHICRPGRTGENCSVSVDICQQNNPCLHGRCELTEGGFRCLCQSGFRGPLCERLKTFLPTSTVPLTTSPVENLEKTETIVTQERNTKVSDVTSTTESTTSLIMESTNETMKSNNSSYMIAERLHIAVVCIVGFVLILSVLVAVAICIWKMRRRDEPLSIPPPPKCAVPKICLNQSPLRYTLSPTTCYHFPQPSLPSTIVPAIYMSQEDLTV